MKKFYLNTPIYYVNAAPHIGHAYTTIVSDALTRFHQLQREDTRLVTGTDENSQKNIEAMRKAGESDINAYLFRMAMVWQETWKALDLRVDDFIRTTEERHVKGVERFWNAVQKSGDIYLGEYEGWYCAGCEAFKTETELANGRCPLHPNVDAQRMKEKNYFFRLSTYRDQLLTLVDQPGFVQPEARRNEIRNYIRDHLTDISISREAKALEIGIGVPGDSSQRIYVWFDALLNYITAIGYGTDDALFKKWWPTDLEPLGKDIIKFHCALWPAMLMSAAKNDSLLQGEDGQALLPKTIYAHGFFTVDGQKISKSLGNAIDPKALVDRYGIDPLRYFLLREIPFGEDGDFSEARLKERYASDLGNTLGNLINRVIAMSRKYFDGKVPEGSATSALGVEEVAGSVKQAYASHRCDQALETIWSGLFRANKYVEETQPFKLFASDPKATGLVLYELLEASRIYAWMLYPVMPHIAQEIWNQLGLDASAELQKGWEAGIKWGGLKSGAVLSEPQPLFPRI